MPRFVKVRKARKTYTCDNNGTFAHDPTIQPGDKYARISSPPDYLDPKGTPWAYTILCDYCWGCEPKATEPESDTE